MNILRKGALVAMVTGSMLAGVVVGAAAFGSNVFAASGTAPAQASSAPAQASSGTFKPNEDPAHEAGESAAREAQEDAGQVPTVP